VNYYGQPKFDRVKTLIDAEVRRGVRSLKASYLSRTYKVDPAIAQQVLSDLVATGDLSMHYQVLCSGEHERFDIDREFEHKEEIPRYELQCTRCGDRYVPSEENILLSFEPTKSYLEELAHQT